MDVAFARESKCERQCKFLIGTADTAFVAQCDSCLPAGKNKTWNARVGVGARHAGMGDGQRAGFIFHIVANDGDLVSCFTGQGCRCGEGVCTGCDNLIAGAGEAWCVRRREPRGLCQVSPEGGGYGNIEMVENCVGILATSLRGYCGA